MYPASRVTAQARREQTSRSGIIEAAVHKALTKHSWRGFASCVPNYWAERSLVRQNMGRSRGAEVLLSSEGVALAWTHGYYLMPYGGLLWEDVHWVVPLHREKWILCRQSAVHWTSINSLFIQHPGYIHEGLKVRSVPVWMINPFFFNDIAVTSFNAHVIHVCVNLSIAACSIYKHSTTNKQHVNNFHNSWLQYVYMLKSIYYKFGPQ